jgi:hypothetical protein
VSAPLHAVATARATAQPPLTSQEAASPDRIVTMHKPTHTGQTLQDAGLRNSSWTSALLPLGFAVFVLLLIVSIAVLFR